MTDRRSLLLGLACAAVAGCAPSISGATRHDRGQSPVDLRPSAAAAADGAPLLFDYPDAVDLRIAYVHRDGDQGCRIRGREETVEAEVTAGSGSVQDADVRYGLVQYHFHTPSEHTVDAERFPVEQHLVHRAEDGRVLVVAVFLVPGGRGTPQDEVLARLPDECGQAIELTGVRLRGGLPRDLAGYRYPGSLTTAPYTEGVLWHVVREPFAVEAATLDRFRRLFPDGDARAVNPLAGRAVRMTAARG